MIQDVNVKALKKNAFRYSKVRGETASRIRIPGASSRQRAWPGSWRLPRSSEMARSS